jgi:hypothetical protein
MTWCRTCCCWCMALGGVLSCRLPIEGCGLLMAMLQDLPAIGCGTGLRRRPRSLAHRHASGAWWSSAHLPLRNGMGIHAPAQRHSGNGKVGAYSTFPLSRGTSKRSGLRIRIMASRRLARWSRRWEAWNRHMLQELVRLLLLYTQAKALQIPQCCNMLQSSESKVRCGDDQKKAATQRGKSHGLQSRGVLAVSVSVVIVASSNRDL